MLDYCWASVVDVGPALIQHWASLTCLLDYTDGQTDIVLTPIKVITDLFVIQHVEMIQTYVHVYTR